MLPFSTYMYFFLHSPTSIIMLAIHQMIQKTNCFDVTFCTFIKDIWTVLRRHRNRARTVDSIKKFSVFPLRHPLSLVILVDIRFRAVIATLFYKTFYSLRDIFHGVGKTICMLQRTSSNFPTPNFEIRIAPTIFFRIIEILMLHLFDKINYLTHNPIHSVVGYKLSEIACSTLTSNQGWKYCRTYLSSIIRQLALGLLPLIISKVQLGKFVRKYFQVSTIFATKYVFLTPS